MAEFARGNPARWWKSRSCGGPSRAPRSLFISPLRRWATTLALGVLLLLLAGIGYLTQPKRLSRLSEVLLSHVIGGQVRVGSGHLSMAGTLILEGVEVHVPESAEAPASGVPIFSANQIEARFDWLSLLFGRLSATQLVAISPTFRPIEDRTSGIWNYQHLRPGGFGATSVRPRGAARRITLPVILLKDARVKWGEHHDGRLEQTAEAVIDADMLPDPADPRIYRFTFTQLFPSSVPGASGEASSVLRGTFDTSTTACKATCEDLTMSHALLSAMPRQVRDWCIRHELAGRISRLDVAYDPATSLSLSLAFDGVAMMFHVVPQPGIVLADERPIYELPLRDVRGNVTFNLEPPAIRASHLTGNILGYQFVARCDVDGMSLDDPFTLDVRLPGAMLDEEHPPVFMAFRLGQDLIQRLAPHGTMDLALALRRGAAGEDVQLHGTIDVDPEGKGDGRMRYAQFPFPLDHVRGRITFDRRFVSFHGVTAKADESDMQITGIAGITRHDRSVDFTVRSNNAFFDERMAACLPQKILEAWNQFTVSGQGGFIFRMKRGGAPSDKLEIVVEVNLVRGSGYVHAMPYPFRDVTGRIIFSADETLLENLSGVVGDDATGRVTVNGVVRHPRGHLSTVAPELRVNADIPIDQRLIQCLPAELQDRLQFASPGGRLDFAGTLERSAKSAESNAALIQFAGQLQWTSGTLDLAYHGEHLHFSGITAQGLLSPDGLRVDSAAGDLHLPGPGGGATGEDQRLALTIRGSLDSDYAGVMDVTARIQDFVLEKNAPGILPGSWASAWNIYAPGGNIDLAAEATVTLRPATTSATASAGSTGVGTGSITIDTWHALLTPRDARLHLIDWPGPLEEINGTVELAADRITMTNLSAAMAGVAFFWSGEYLPKSRGITLSGKAQGQEFPRSWLGVLPQPIARNLDTTREDVAFTLDLPTLARRGPDDPWTFEGSLETTNLAVTRPLTMAARSTRLAGKGTLAPGAGERDAAFDFAGDLAATETNVHNHTLETLAATVHVHSDQRMIEISELHAKVAGGTLQGSIEVTTQGPPQEPSGATIGATGAMPPEGGYKADLVLNDADLSRLALPGAVTEAERKTVGNGRVAASLAIQESFGSDSDRTGRGELTVREGSIYNVPLAMGLMQIVTLRLPVAQSFQQASISYYLRDNQITFERILLESRGINLAGAGTVTLGGGELNLSFVTESPDEVFIPVLTPILRETRNEILQLSVTGPLDDPRITPVPLSAISNTLRALLPPPRADANR